MNSSLMVIRLFQTLNCKTNKYKIKWVNQDKDQKWGKTFQQLEMHKVQGHKITMTRIKGKVKTEDSITQLWIVTLLCRLNKILLINRESWVLFSSLIKLVKLNIRRYSKINKSNNNQDQLLDNNNTNSIWIILLHLTNINLRINQILS